MVDATSTTGNGLAIIVTDPTFNRNFPIAEVFPQLEMYIGKSSSSSSPVSQYINYRDNGFCLEGHMPLSDSVSICMRVYSNTPRM